MCTRRASSRSDDRSLDEPPATYTVGKMEKLPKSAEMSSPLILRLVGINHKDPAMRRQLIEWLVACSAKYGKPDFVAVEWDESIFGAVKAKRAEFRQLLKQEWPDISDPLLNTLVLSLGYEGDSHIDVYSNVDVLWLDEGRKEGLGDDDMTKGFVEKCARWRLRDYKAFLGKWPTDADDSMILKQMSNGASKVSEFKPNSRDDKWVSRIVMKSTQTIDCRWAIAIVGEGHTRKLSGTMRSQLEKLNYICEVYSLISAEGSN